MLTARSVNFTTSLVGAMICQIGEVDILKEVCRFCDILSGNLKGKEDHPIWENEGYFSLASIGALVEGWILIVPKKHVISMKEVHAIYNQMKTQ